VRLPALVVTTLLGLSACTPEETRPPLDSGDDGSSDCQGNVEFIEGNTMQFTGLVRTEDGEPAVGATVRLRDDAGVPPGDLATASTDATGAFTMVSDDITAWPGCWAVLSDYRMKARLDDAVGEIAITKDIGEAWIRDEQDVALEDKPIVVR